MLLDNGTGLYVAFQADDGDLLRITNSSGSVGSVNTTSPFTWANTDEIIIQGSYKAS